MDAYQLQLQLQPQQHRANCTAIHLPRSPAHRTGALKAIAVARTKITHPSAPASATVKAARTEMDADPKQHKHQVVPQVARVAKYACFQNGYVPTQGLTFAMLLLPLLMHQAG